MSDLMQAKRRIPTADHSFANAAVAIHAASPASRVSLRATTKGATAFGKSLGLELPKKPSTSTKKSGKTALWLGPDEWLIIDEKSTDETMVPRLANKEFSAVDVSHRNAAYILSGKGAENTLNAGCPRDLSLQAFPVGSATRTVFGKAEVVLYRIDKTSFRVEFWRSFTPYVWGLLLDAAKDAHV